MKCGIIMPISPIGNYSTEYWKALKNSIINCARVAGFKEPEMVSTEKTTLSILQRIFFNLLTNEMAVCVISGHNPNVLYELGIRIAFDMPCIILKDEITRPPFDLNSFEYMEYPTELSLMHEEFEAQLTQTLVSYYDKLSRNKEIPSTLEGLLGKEYLKIKRKPSKDIRGFFEYRCLVNSSGYCHGGLCKIDSVEANGNFIGWKLNGYRYYRRESEKNKFIRFDEPFNWETNNAVLFANNNFIVSYDIQAPATQSKSWRKKDAINIQGFIEGKLSFDEKRVSVKAFEGYYHQDEGIQIVKGQFKMTKIKERDFNNPAAYNFTLMPLKRKNKWV